MLYLYKQSESVAVRRRVYMILVSATDGITEATGITGTPYLSKNGATPTATTNTITEVDSTNLPGHYYVELTAAELDTLGFLSIRFKAASTAAFQFVGQVVADDPYIQHTGPGLSLPSGTKMAGGMKKEEMIDLAKMVWNVILRDKETAKDILLSRSEFNPAEDVVKTTDYDDSELKAGIENVLASLKELNQSEALEERHKQVLESLKTVASNKDVSGVLSSLDSLGKQITSSLESLNIKQLSQAVKALQPNIDKTNSDLAENVRTIEKLREEFDGFQKTVEEFKQQMYEEIDIEQRLERLGNATRDKAVIEMVEKMTELKDQMQDIAKKILLAITDSKYKILSDKP